MISTTAPSHGPALVWFRDDLRVSDHPALQHVIRSGVPIVCLYVLEEDATQRVIGGAARWWLAGSLRALDEALRKRGGALVLRRGKAVDVVPAVVRELGVSAAFWNRRVGSGAVVDASVEAALSKGGVSVTTFQGSFLHEPPLHNKSGQPFKVFTPFWRTLRSGPEPRRPLPAPSRIEGVSGVESDALNDWGLEPTRPDWAGGLRQSWIRGEVAAQDRLAEFVDDTLTGYSTGRDRPDRLGTSRLSPSLRFGEVSPFQVWHAVRGAVEAGHANGGDAERFLSEIGWREFSYHLLHLNPDLDRRNIDVRFDRFPWLNDPAGLRSWQLGQTGYPLVDAGMRQLWQTGWMHNRVRMVVASFLIKHLMIDWREGERWFWDTLVDADPANNPASWQWVAGCGADAAPYFRIFNPVTQSQKFDSQGDYIRRFVPELAALPANAIHSPWTAPPMELAAHGVTLGRTYPSPIVDHHEARERALRAFARIRGG